MTYVKICGLTRRCDVDLAIELGAHYLGFIMVPHSKRALNEQQLDLLCSQIPPHIKKVGVFQNAPLEQINKLALKYFDIIQLHGNETFEMQHNISCECWKVLHEPSPFIASYHVSAFLIDHAKGGSGEQANWGFAKEMAEKYSILLAGGIGAHNIKEAIRFVNPFGVDLSSSIEDAPGIKSKSKMEQFFNQLKGVL